jgi:hypothetical protein
VCFTPFGVASSEVKQRFITADPAGPRNTRVYSISKRRWKAPLEPLEGFREIKLRLSSHAI